MNKTIFTIIIPTYNRLSDLFVCLGSLTQLDYPKSDFEVIVINDGNDRADRTIHCFKENLNIELMQAQGKGPAMARNQGARAAKGTFLAFIDDDCTVDKMWLKHLGHNLKWFPNSIIGGKTTNGLDLNIYSSASQLIIDYLYNHYNKFSNQGEFVTSNNFALTKVRFEQVGGFNENFPIAGGEDRHFCRKWLNYGYKIIYEQKAIVHHWHELHINSFCQQQFNYGRGAYIFKSRLKQNNKFESKSFYIELLLYPIKKAKKDKVKLTILFVISQIAILAGFLHQKSIAENHQKCHEQQPNT